MNNNLTQTSASI